MVETFQTLFSPLRNKRKRKRAASLDSVNSKGKNLLQRHRYPQEDTVQLEEEELAPITPRPSVGKSFLRGVVVKTIKSGEEISGDVSSPLKIPTFFNPHLKNKDTYSSELHFVLSRF